MIYKKFVLINKVVILYRTVTNFLPGFIPYISKIFVASVVNIFWTFSPVIADVLKYTALIDFAYSSHCSKSKFGVLSDLWPAFYYISWNIYEIKSMIICMYIKYRLFIYLIWMTISSYKSTYIHHIISFLLHITYTHIRYILWLFTYTYTALWICLKFQIPNPSQ